MILKSRLLSSIPGVAHGFSTRLTDVKAELGEVASVKQVHGNRVVEARSTQGEQADGIYSRERNTAMGIYTADCVPVLIACTEGQCAAAVHAGWRGAVARILHQTFIALDTPIARLRFALGPSIGFEAFEVGDEVIAAAEQSLDTPEARRRLPAERWDNGKWHLDLRALLIAQLAELGAARSQIERVGGCTVQEVGLYHSYRRDRAGGRQLSAIALV